MLDNLSPPSTLPRVLIDFDLFDAVLLDLDGTIYHEEHPLPGAVELVRRFEAQRRKYACLTNSTSSPDRIAARLQRMGIALDAHHIYTAAAATVDYVLQTFTNPRIFNLATEGIHEMLDGKVQWIEGEEGPCDAVICGVPLSVYATDERRRVAMLHVRRGAQLIGICADRVYPSPRGLEFGVGALTAMIAYAANVRPVFCGKPEKLFFDELCHRLGVAPGRCVLIGDNLESDIAGAKGVGMKTILTLGGVSSREDVERLPPAARPDWIIDDLTKLL
jgi:4-nitrophenyl phosphatase